MISLLDKYMLRSDRWLSWLHFVVSLPPAQVEARRSVTAGHGSVTTGRPVRGHGPSRPVTSLRVWSWPSRRRAGGPGPLALATLESLVHEKLACETGVRSLCAARAAPLEPLSAAPPSVASLLT